MLSEAKIRQLEHCMGRVTVYRAVRGEYTEKKSRFIADLSYAESEADAEAAVARARKEFYDARHHCSAFVLLPEGASQPVLRSSDDGEPQGTAGHPMLDVLTGASLVNTAAVVTRYFGGTLLGTGGLVRSYTKALQDAIEKSVLIERKRGIPLLLRADYTAIGKLEYYFAKESLTAMEKEYGEQVTVKLLVPDLQAAAVKKEIISITGGKSVPEEVEATEYAVLDGQVLTGKALLGDAAAL